MRLFLLWFATLFAISVFGDEPNIDQVKKKFKGGAYTVTWGTPAIFDVNSELEIGNGNGHGFTLGWLRFLPGKDGVEVISLQFKEDKKHYKSKWPLDNESTVITHTKMKQETYASLLHDLAIADSAQLEKTPQLKASITSSDFWVYAQLNLNKKTLLDYNWAGYRSTFDDIAYTKPQAMVALAQEAIKGLEFKEYVLTEADRRWASEKFIRDIKVLSNMQFTWWVKERYIIMIGSVGDITALPALRDFLRMNAEPTNRLVYYAINAITRITKKDVRDKPVEEMDLEKTLPKILELLNEIK